MEYLILIFKFFIATFIIEALKLLKYKNRTLCFNWDVHIMYILYYMY